MARIVSGNDGLYLACTCGERLTQEQTAKTLIDQLGDDGVRCGKCGASWRLCLEFGAQPGHVHEVLVNSGRRPVGIPAICPGEVIRV